MKASGKGGSTMRGEYHTEQRRGKKREVFIHIERGEATYAVYPKSMVNRRCRRKANGKGGRGYQREQRKRRGRCSYT